MFFQNIGSFLGTTQGYVPQDMTLHVIIKYESNGDLLGYICRISILVSVHSLASHNLVMTVVTTTVTIKVVTS